MALLVSFWIEHKCNKWEPILFQNVDKECRSMPMAPITILVKQETHGGIFKNNNIQKLTKITTGGLNCSTSRRFEVLELVRFFDDFHGRFRFLCLMGIKRWNR